MKHENQFWFLTSDSPDLLYDSTKKQWVSERKYKYSGSPWWGDFPCHSFRAAKRHLRKHNEIPKGTEFRLVGKFVGCDRYLIKR